MIFSKSEKLATGFTVVALMKSLLISAGINPMKRLIITILSKGKSRFHTKPYVCNFPLLNSRINKTEKNKIDVWVNVFSIKGKFLNRSVLPEIVIINILEITNTNKPNKLTVKILNRGCFIFFILIIAPKGLAMVRGTNPDDYFTLNHSMQSCGSGAFDLRIVLFYNALFCCWIVQLFEMIQ